MAPAAPPWRNRLATMTPSTRTFSRLLPIVFGCAIAAAQQAAVAPTATARVVAVDLAADGADPGYLAAARAAAAFHRTEVAAWDGRDLAALRGLLGTDPPPALLFVLRPATLDLVLHRRILLASIACDDDPLPDFAFGYLTGGDGADCERFWRRIEALHASAPIGGRWCSGAVCAGERSFRVPAAKDGMAARAGFAEVQHYFATGDAQRLDAVERALADGEDAAVLEFTGCGDPQGIWLFDDDRNRQRDRHWDYEPARVGLDPDGSMPRLLAARFRRLQWRSPIVWSGTCHSGAVDRVFVEGDIVATFGRTARTTVHRLAVDESLALAWIHAGAAAVIAPIGANHGLAVSGEVDVALGRGCSLGEALKSTWDDVCLAAGGAPRLDLPVAGEPHAHGEPVMQGGGANRALFGDPTLRPFRAVADPRVRIAARRTDGGLQVTVARDAGFVASAWDMYGTRRGEDWRIGARIDLTALGVTGPIGAVAVAGPDGDALPYTVRHATVEQHAGRRWLHLQANAPRKAVENKAVTAVFTVQLP